MSNPIETIGHDLKVAAVDVEHAVVKAVEFLPHAIELLDTAIKDQPAVKSAVQELIKQGTAIAGDVTLAAVAKGIDLAADSKALADAETFVSYFVGTFLPLIETIYTAAKADVQQ